MEYTIVPLSTENIEEATALVHDIFPDEAAEKINPGLAFKVSLDPEQYQNFFQEDKSDNLRYFAAIENENSEVIGTTGLYHLKTEPQDIVWLGWYCVKPSYRGKGVGKALLQFVIDKAKSERRTKLKLYADAQATTALALYEKFGFKTVKVEQADGWQVVYQELFLL